ncbi:MAG: type IV secretion system DNA-binding domain-containing protein [Candidatus Berkelbacteria bacterium]|nr:type IV secretion system DNA-binding domain-containing protein [Candidatus Berkelbacteria bacterium]
MTTSARPSGKFHLAGEAGFQFALNYVKIIVIILSRKIVMPINSTELEKKHKSDHKLLMIEVPQENEQKPQAAEAMFSALHGIFKEHLSFEVVSESKFIRFYVYTPDSLKDFVESQIYAQYPSVEINEVPDYTENIEKESHWAFCEFEMSKDDFFPIKTFLNFDVDPIAAITAPLSKVAEGEKVWMEILVKPAKEGWQDEGMEYVQAVKAGKDLKAGFGKKFARFLGELWDTATAYQSESKSSEAPDLPGPVQEALKGIELKVTKLGFETKIRILSISDKPEKAEHRLMQAAAAFQQFSMINLNSFKKGPISVDKSQDLEIYKSRHFDHGYIFNVEELASIFHLPNLTVKTPTIVWARAKKGEPPSNLPIKGEIPQDNLTVFAKTNFRHLTKDFGLKLSDRRMHTYLIGKTGTGKTNTLESMALDDIKEGRGLAVVDPHGDFVDFVLDRIPPHRINDVILFDPSDFENPIGFNLLENVDPDARNVVASGLIGIFKKIWGDISWGPRLEYILRNTILSLIAYPDSTMLGIMRILVDKRFRTKVINKVDDPILKDFWLNEFERYDPKFRTEAIAPIQNKVGQFLSSTTIRNIVGQPRSSFDLKQIMDKKKILLVSLPVGKIGEDNSALLGAMMITKIQLTSMERAHVAEEKRVDFYLYVDEFQNFATEAFATILSEARKYHLNITLANQYIAQMPEEVRDAVFGNIGTIISFRVGAQDSPFLAKEYAPVFEENDLVNLDKYNIYLKMSIDGVTCPAFSAITLPPSIVTTSNKEKVVKLSQERYTKPREFVEEKIAGWIEEVSGGLAATDETTRERRKEPKKVEIKEVKVGDRVFGNFVDNNGRNWYALIRTEKTVTPDIKPLEEGKVVKLKE